MQDHDTKLIESRKKLLQAVGGEEDITFIRLFGNIGDDLIYAGTRKLLSTLNYTELSVFYLQPVSGHTAIIAGSGGWCGPFSDIPDFLPIIEKRFKKVIVFPSSFDISIAKVRNAIEGSNALFFAREEVSYDQIKNICHAELAHDTAFFFDYTPYCRSGIGNLNAFRTDKEASGVLIPENNDDISLTCDSMDEWLWKISGYEYICTDRAHVMIAAALLGKKVEYRSSNYHKVPAIAEFALKGFPVYQKEMVSPFERKGDSNSKDTPEKKENNEAKQIRRMIIEILGLISPEEKFILVDEEQVRYELGKRSTAIPFLEKDGQYWGPPKDAAAAIHEFERLHKTGVSFLIVTWTGFWWLEYYIEWHHYLQSNFTVILQNERLVVFDLRNKTKKNG